MFRSLLDAVTSCNSEHEGHQHAVSYNMVWSGIADSLSRDLAHSLGVFTHVEPIALEPYCATCLYRFAASEKVYLRRLANEIKDRVLYCLPFSEFGDRFFPPSIL